MTSYIKLLALSLVCSCGGKVVTRSTSNDDGSGNVGIGGNPTASGSAGAGGEPSATECELLVEPIVTCTQSCTTCGNDCQGGCTQVFSSPNEKCTFLCGWGCDQTCENSEDALLVCDGDCNQVVSGVDVLLVCLEGCSQVADGSASATLFCTEGSCTQQCLSACTMVCDETCTQLCADGKPPKPCANLNYRTCGDAPCDIAP